MSAMGWIQSSLGLDITGEWEQLVLVCVGGHNYTCLRQTFRRYVNSRVFSAILSNNGRKAEDGSIVIDRDGTIFRHVLNYLRTNTLMLPDGFDEWEILLDDAKFYEIKGMEDAILSHPQYRMRIFKRTLPHGVYLRWMPNGNVDLVPLLPLLTTQDGTLKYSDRDVLSCEEAVAILISTYSMRVEHWQKDAAEGGICNHVFFSLR